jgi:hypothetical protein
MLHPAFVVPAAVTKQIITNGNAPKFEITKLPLAGMVAETAAPLEQQIVNYKFGTLLEETYGLFIVNVTFPSISQHM